jgi:TATA-binding protein-associated factor Taf7
MREVKRVEMDGEGSCKTRFGSAAARPGLNAAGDPEDDEEEEKKKPEEDEEDEEDEENDGEEEEVPWQVAGLHSGEREVRGQLSLSRKGVFE